jgi:hypothetical protein
LQRLYLYHLVIFVWSQSYYFTTKTLAL